MIKRILAYTAIICFVCFLGACKSTKLVRPTAESLETLQNLSAKLQVIIPYNGEDQILNGTMKMITGERIQLSVLMPVIRNEVIRVDITPDRLLLLDRKNKKFLSATWDEVNERIENKTSHGKIENILMKASLPGGDYIITGDRMGIPSLSNAQLIFHDFSVHEISLIPTRVSDRYSAVTLDELQTLLYSL